MKAKFSFVAPSENLFEVELITGTVHLNLPSKAVFEELLNISKSLKKGNAVAGIEIVERICYKLLSDNIEKIAVTKKNIPIDFSAGISFITKYFEFVTGVLKSPN